MVEGKTVAVREEEIVLQKPFGQLKRFVREGVQGGPRLLIVAPMSGHYATLLRGTVERMLPKHDVYITDWRDARMRAAGRMAAFDLDDYIDYLRSNSSNISAPDAHMLAVCQPSVPCYAAVACLMSASNRIRCLPENADHDGRPDRHSPSAHQPSTMLAMERPFTPGFRKYRDCRRVPYTLSGRGPKSLSRFPSACRLSCR